MKETGGFMRINRNIVLIAIAVVGLGLQWLQSHTRTNALRFERSERLLTFDEIVPFVRKAGETISENKNFAQARFAVQNLRGRIVNRVEQVVEKAAEVVAEVLTPNAEKSSEVAADGTAKPADATQAEKDAEALLAQKAKEQEEEEKVVIGYDEEGNPIFKAESTEEGEEGEDSEVAEDETETPDGQPEAEEVADTEKETPKAAAAGNAVQVVTAAGGPAVEEEAKDEEDMSYEAWVKLVVNQADQAAVKKLIEYYQTGRVTKAVFYRLVKDMLADNRATIKKQGTYCVEKTPSFDSFLILTAVYKAEPFGSEISEDVVKALKQYETLTYLDVLESVLTSEADSVTTYARLLAMQKLEAAASHYMKRDTASQGEEGGEVIPEGENSSQGEDDISKLSSTQLKFHKVIGVLEEFIQRNSAEPEAIGYAQTALNNLRKHIDAILES
jgi:hypothetical protein